MKKYRPETGYSFVTGFIRAYEVRGITDNIVDHLIHSESLKQASEILRGTNYNEYFRDHGDIDEDLEIISWKRKGVLDFIDTYSLDKDLSLLMRIPYDYHNIKYLLKRKIFETPGLEGVACCGIIDRESIIRIFETENYSELPLSMEQAVTTAVEFYYEKKYPIVIDLVADHFFNFDLIKISNVINSPFIKGYYEVYSDLVNINTLLRMKLVPDDEQIRKLVFLHGGNIDIEELRKLDLENLNEIKACTRKYGYENVAESLDHYGGNIFVLEREINNHLTNYLREARFYIWGIEPLFVLGKAVENDLSIIGIILSGIINNISESKILNRLPVPYLGGEK